MYNSCVERRLSFPFSLRIGKPFIQIYACLILMLFGWSAYRVLLFPYGVDYGEAPLMDQVKRIENGDVVYKANIDEPPYIVANYPPLYTLLVAAINLTLKIPLFQAGRTISILFSIGSAVIIGLFGLHLTGNKWLGVLGAVIFLGNPYVLLWSSMARVDMMALGFSLLGLWILYRWRNNNYQIAFACLLFMLSIYTRQTYLLAGPLAGFAWLWYQNKKRAIYFILTLGISSLLIFGIINAITHHGFYSNIVVANINQYDLSRTLALFKQLFILIPVILLITLIAITYVLRSVQQDKATDTDHRNASAFMLYGLGFFTIGALISALTIGKVGSDVNYFLELIAICSIWSVIGLKYLMDQNNVSKFLAFGLFSIQAIWLFVGGFFLMRSMVNTRWNALPSYDAMFSQVQKATREGKVLSDDYLDMVVLSGQSIYYQPFEYGQLYHAGLWDPEPLADEIKQGSFPLILIGGNTVNKTCCWPPPVVNAIENSYITTLTDTYIVLTPKK